MKEAKKHRILIADDEKIMRMDLKEILISAGYEVVAEAKDGLEALQLCEVHQPDLCVLDIKMPILDGITVAKRSIEKGLVKSVVLLSAYSDREFVNMAKEIGVLGYIVKPIDERMLIPTIELAIENGKSYQHMSSKIQAMTQKLDDRILIERAKGLLMERERISEEEAYKKMRKISMDSRMSMCELAKLILGD